jgi:predicted NAD/FAD-binding protein
VLRVTERVPGGAPSRPRRIAVVGSGVAGLSAAHVLQTACDVTLFEADARLGGHAHTHTVRDAGRDLRIDTGFIVHNRRTYPTLLRLFDELGVETQETEMSLSVRCESAGLEYAGGKGVVGLVPRLSSLGRPAYLRMLGEVPRFHRMARALLDHPAHGDQDEPLGAMLARGGFSAFFLDYFMRPLVAAVWSCDPARALEYPARYLFAFLDHHGMLSVTGSPTWRTVTGGSATYVERLAAGLHRVRTATPVSRVWEDVDGVLVEHAQGRERFDAAVVATHPHQALRLLAAPTPSQRAVLRAIPYSPNTAQLHTDESLLPTAARARASWNYLVPREAPDNVVVTYDLTRLQRLPRSGPRYLVTLGGKSIIDPNQVIATMEYEHPLYTPESVAAQRRLPEIASDRLVFAGAYHGWGFHEDGARSGVAAAARLGVHWAPSRAAHGILRDAEVADARRRDAELDDDGRQDPVPA